MFPRPEPQLVRVRTYMLLLLAAAVLGGGAAEVTNVVGKMQRAEVAL